VWWWFFLSFEVLAYFAIPWGLFIDQEVRRPQIPLKDRTEVNNRLLTEFQCYPVYLSDELAEKHYNGFSNSILWPLFHYHPGEMNFDEDNWLAYREANMRFAEVVNTFVGSGDMVWVQVGKRRIVGQRLRRC
jgi:trehalose-6-phosphate synthase